MVYCNYYTRKMFLEHGQLWYIFCRCHRSHHPFVGGITGNRNFLLRKNIPTCRSSRPALPGTASQGNPVGVSRVPSLQTLRTTQEKPPPGLATGDSGAQPDTTTPVPRLSKQTSHIGSIVCALYSTPLQFLYAPGLCSASNYITRPYDTAS